MVSVPCVTTTRLPGGAARTAATMTETSSCVISVLSF